MKSLICLGILLLVAACREKEMLPASSPGTARSLAQGEVVGFLAKNGAQVWRGLPFAASTAGENRWRGPRPAPEWQGVREALHFAERCSQLTNQSDEDEGLEAGLIIGSEDCLAVDIYSPADAQGKALPVMVWIHGGGNVWGRSSAYDGSRLAENEKVVVVATQYRLGPLGWFSHPSLRESATTPEDAAASFATLDLIAALKWVRGNIGVFGGATDNVTVFGESAGGHNVAALLASPLAEGLFHRAIIQSGSFDSTSLAAAQGFEGTLANTSMEVAKRLGVSKAEELRAVPLAELFAAYEQGSGFLDVPRVIEDGVVLPARPLREAFASTETFHTVPIMVGTNRDEMKLFYAGNPELIKKALGFLPVPHDQEFYDALTGYISRLWRIRAVDQPAAMMARAGHHAVYAYRFDWDDGGRLLSMDFKTLFGAAHGFEIPFVFNRFQYLGDADRFLFQDRTASERENLSRAMGGYWASFARDGLPSSPAGPPWPTYSEKGASFLRFDTDSDGGIEVAQGADTLEALVVDLKGDPRLDKVQRCRIIREMGEWMFTRPIYETVRAAVECR
ncbi:MAG: carboxylesterase family protein [Deltaproteobacteria bacterium]|nr:carboxylesterase family protein [Deltaproteobacteria bacterium]